MPELQALLDLLYRKHKPARGGTLASYIPELAKADPNRFALASCGVDGSRAGAGDLNARFTLQSVSKPFVFGLALAAHGRKRVREEVGVEPTGDSFHSVIRLDADRKRPYNPMINPGAIAMAGLIPGGTPARRQTALLKGLSVFAGRPLSINDKVFRSERSTGHRNRAIAHLMRHFGSIPGEIEHTLDLYFKQCATAVDCRDLALMGATLANGGVNPVTGKRALPARFVRDLLTLMFTCGLYTYAGEWAYTVGLPAKSGVSGAILAVVPGKMGVAAFSPRVDAHGNSVRGLKALREFSARRNLHVFEAR